MSSEAEPTRGLTIVRMGLVASQFQSASPLILDVMSAPEVRQQVGGEPELSVDVSHRHVYGGEPGQVSVHLRVQATVTGPKGALVIASSEFVAFYIREEGCPASLEDLVNIFAPAQLYAFCREHIADLCRRAGGAVVLPPAHFTSKAPPPAKPAADPG